MRPHLARQEKTFLNPVQVWVNGHEWAKRQAIKAGIGFVALPNGFASCEDPTGLQPPRPRASAGLLFAPIRSNRLTNA